MICKACGDKVHRHPSVFYRDWPLPRDTKKYKKWAYCDECFRELVAGEIGEPPKPTCPPAHTGLTLRQRCKLDKTTGG
jgi:hypothetical protein